jgi:signal transduction histidine kinase
MVKVNDEGLRLIKDMLQVNSLTHQPVEEEPINLHQLIHESVLPSLQEQANKKQISFCSSVDEELTLWSDSLSLKRILENLLSNAIKFSLHGATVFLRVLSSDDAVYISVQDQGPGISEADQKKMFKKFQRLSARPTSGETSYGLGLAIVKGLVDKLHGEIAVNSQLNVGTEFSIKLTRSNRLLPMQSLTVNH